MTAKYSLHLHLQNITPFSYNNYCTHKLPFPLTIHTRVDIVDYCSYIEELNHVKHMEDIGLFPPTQL